MSQNATTVVQSVFLIASFALGFVSAVFSEPARRFLFKPKLKLTFSGRDDCIALTPMTVGINAMYVRIRVTNERRQIARACRAFLIKVEKKGDDGAFHSTSYADSLPLAWSCQPEGYERAPIDLLHGVSQYVDVVMTMDGGRRLMPQIAPFPLRYAPLFADEVAIFKFTVQVSGDGVDPRTQTLVINWNGQWNNLEAHVFEA